MVQLNKWVESDEMLLELLPLNNKEFERDVYFLFFSVKL